MSERVVGYRAVARLGQCRPAQVEAAAAVVNQTWPPHMEETLSGDEIYANGQLNLVLVGNDCSMSMP